MRVDPEILNRTVVQPKRQGLAVVAAFAAVGAAFWMWIAALSLGYGGASHLIILPVGLIGMAVFGWILYWALKRRTNDEPALIIDEIGLYDNVSPVCAGRVKWREMERVWLRGPSWMQFLCVRPDEVRTYLDSQEEVKGAVMRFQNTIFDAPILIPMSVLELSPEDIWFHITESAGAAQRQDTPTHQNFVAGA